MKFLYQLPFIFFLCAGILSCKGSPPKNPDAVSKVANKPDASEATTVQWLTFEEAVAKNTEHPKQLFIDFYTDWCGWCKVMDRNTFADAEVAKLLNNYFYPVKFNAEQREPVVFNGKTYNFIPQGNRGYNELAANIMQGEMSYPTGIFLNEKYEIITPVSGYVAPREFEPILSFLGQRLYEGDESFENFKANYQSSGPANPPVTPAGSH